MTECSWIIGCVALVVAHCPVNGIPYNVEV